MRSNSMKLSDYVIDFLAKQGVRHAFVVTGGASIHLLHSLADHPDIDFICPHHEQAAAMAADAYARVTGGFGCAMATSGPGATNLITGIAGAFFDSVPTIFITGQVATFRMKNDTGVRQLGFQETDIVPMLAPVTKYAVQIRDPNRIAYELEKAAYIAASGRPGPVVIDIPDDLQRGPVDITALDHYALPVMPRPVPAEGDLGRVLSVLNAAERPVIVLGWGVRLAGGADLVRGDLLKLGVPILTSWGAKDLLPADESLNVGSFGTHGTRAGNFAIQNADFVLSIGARLSTRETGTPATSWARGAKLAIVDIDTTEIGKFTAMDRPVDIAVNADAREFLEVFLPLAKDRPLKPLQDWRRRIDDWKARYPICDPANRQSRRVDPYVFVEALAAHLPEDEHIFIDTGCAVAWMMQGFPVRGGQRLFHDFNNTAMGWALPAAIGGALALGGHRVTCVSGDGSLMMNIQELATIMRHRLPVLLVVINNGGYSMVQQTEEQWLGGRHVGTSYEGGLGFPDLKTLAAAFTIPAFVIENASDVKPILKESVAIDGPVLVDVRIDGAERVVPQSKFGYPIEDSEPLLPRDEFLANMIVAPMPKSQEPIE